MPPARGDLTGCPWHDVKAKLREVGLRPTRQRMALGWLLFGKGDRHVTAELLYEEAHNAKVPVSLATIYNTLHQFTQAGLLRQVAVDGSKTYFDTNVTEHHHFFIEGDNALVDIPGAEMRLDLAGGETIRTEVSAKFTRATVDEMLGEASMQLEEWFTDPAERFALALASPVARRAVRSTRR